MPLVGLVDGDRKVSSLLSDDEWATLKKDVQAKRVALALRCGQPGHLRSTRKGTRFFAHNPGSGHECDSTGETQQHLRAKDIIVRAAVAAGWDAEPEVRGDGWVSDVLATRGNVRIAFEVQWSNQSDADFEHRQARYQRDGVRGAWFVRHASSIPTVPSADLPIFSLAEDGDDMVTSIGEPRSLGDAVTLLLSGRIKHREYVSNNEPANLRVQVHKHDCYKCAAKFLIWHVNSFGITGACGQERGGWMSYDLFAEDRIENAPGVREAVIAAAAKQSLPVARLHPRSTKTSGTTYMAFVCSGCNATSGDFFIRELLLEEAYDPAYLEVDVEAGERGLRAPHWCIDTGAGHCAQPPEGYRPKFPLDGHDDETFSTTVEVQTVGRTISARDVINTMFGGSYY